MQGTLRSQRINVFPARLPLCEIPDLELPREPQIYQQKPILYLCRYAG